MYYFSGACACAVVAFLGYPWTAIFLWPASVLAATATAYWGIGSALYRKEHGRLPLSTRVLFALGLAGQWVSLFHYRRQGNLWDRVTPVIWIGAKLGDRQAQEAVRQGVTAVLDLTSEFSENKTFLGLAYKNLPVLDLTEMTTLQLREAVRFIAEHSARGAVYIHCKAGYSRTAAAVGAFLIASGQAKNIDESLKLMRRARPAIVFRPEVRVALEKFLHAETAFRLQKEQVASPA